jgi:hypothetical protein
MPRPSFTPAQALDALDARHDELIRKLDELNAQIETALKEFAVRRDTEEAASPAKPVQPQRKLRKAA